MASVISAAVLSVFAPGPEDDGTSSIIAEADQCIADDPLFAARNGGFLTAGANLPPQSNVMFAQSGALRFVAPPSPEPVVSHTVLWDPISGYVVKIHAQDFEFAQEHGDDNAESVSGHALIYVNGERVGRAKAERFSLPANVFDVGENDVTVALVDQDGRNWATMAGEPITSTSRIAQSMTKLLTQ